MTKLAVVFYSLYGHTAKMAEAVAAGAKRISDVTVDIYQVPETLSTEVLQKMHAPAKTAHPIASPDTLLGYDGFILGIPTRYGVWPGQWKSFWDATGQIWSKGGYHGKMAGTFVSTSSQHGGIETTAFTALTTFVHHGIIYVPFGYAKAFGDLTTLTEVIGASPYGAGTCTGPDGSRWPSELELKLASQQGENFASTLAQYTKK